MKCMDCSEYGGNRFLKGTFRNPFSTCGSKLIGDEFFFSSPITVTDVIGDKVFRVPNNYYWRRGLTEPQL